MRHHRRGHAWLAVLAVFMACNDGGSNHGAPAPAPSPSPDPDPDPDPAPDPDPDPTPDPTPDPAPDPAPSPSSSMRLFIEDAPPRFETLRAVRLAIGRVEGIAINSSGVQTSFPLTRTLAEVDVLPLRGGRREQLAFGAVPPGEYHVRLQLTDAEVLTATRSYSTQNGLLTLTGGTAVQGGREYVIEMPFQQRVPVEPNKELQVIVDIDLEESLQAEGDPDQPTRIALSPQLRLRPLLGANSLRGVVRGDAGTPDDRSDDVPLANAKVWIESEGPKGTNGKQVEMQKRTDAQGVYVLAGLSQFDNSFFVFADLDHDTYHVFPLEVFGAVTHDVLLHRTAP